MYLSAVPGSGVGCAESWGSFVWLYLNSLFEILNYAFLESYCRNEKMEFRRAESEGSGGVGWSRAGGTWFLAHPTLFFGIVDACVVCVWLKGDRCRALHVWGVGLCLFRDQYPGAVECGIGVSLTHKRRYIRMYMSVHVFYLSSNISYN
jgi:hypothetical protein